MCVYVCVCVCVCVHECSLATDNIDYTLVLVCVEVYWCLVGVEVYWCLVGVKA